MQHRKTGSFNGTATERSIPAQLVDIRSVTIDKGLSVPDRISSFVSQIKNPYLFKVDGVTVKVEFSPGKSFEEALLCFMAEERDR